LKANNLIESINNVLNEDAYSKFTLSQLYTKLGLNLFAKYLKDICLISMKRLDNFKDMKLSLTDLTDGDISVLFEKQHELYTETLFVYFGKKHGDIWSMYKVTDVRFFLAEQEESETIRGKEVNLSMTLNKVLSRLNGSSLIEKTKQKILKEYEDGE
jgi:hypothetical protein